LVGGQVVTTGVVGLWTNGSYELKDNIRHIVRHWHALVRSGFDLSSVLVGHGTARLMELLDVGVVLEERILEHAENARAEDGGVVRASREDFLASHMFSSSSS
jgi:ABC-type sulfate/molybdate transport systems ATPase subunit